MAKSRTSPEQAGAAAEALALHALAFLAEDPERLGRFLALTGIGPADLKARAGEPEFLGGVLDHLLSDERLLLDILATHASVAEISEAYHWLTADDHLGGDLGKQMSTRVAAVYELLKADLEPPDEDL